MNKYAFLTSLLACLALSACPCIAQEEARRHPGFPLFIDDLLSFPYGTNDRNPYEERMETERHDFTQSTKTVGRGVFQLEAGYLYSYKDNDDEIEHAHSTPETELRFGISDDIELRVRWNYGWQFIDTEENQDSAMDLIWGVKLGMSEQCGLIPESALEIRATAPTGGSSFTLGRVVAGFDYIVAWELENDWTIYGSAGWLPNGIGEFSLVPEEPENENFNVTTASLAFGTNLTEQNTLYAEWFGLFSDGLEDEFSLSFINFGFDHYFNDDFLIDFRLGIGLTDDSEDLLAGVGFGARF